MGIEGTSQQTEKIDNIVCDVIDLIQNSKIIQINIERVTTETGYTTGESEREFSGEIEIKLTILL